MIEHYYKRKHEVGRLRQNCLNAILDQMAERYYEEGFPYAPALDMLHSAECLGDWLRKQDIERKERALKSLQAPATASMRFKAKNSLLAYLESF